MISYVALKRLPSDASPRWRQFVEFSKLTRLKEVISLDCCLCPSVIEILSTEDWEFLSQEKTFFGLFSNLDYLTRKVSQFTDFQILAVSKEPNKEFLGNFNDERFIFKGIDLVEDETRISALTNCGGFPKAFSNDNLNHFGLIETIEIAVEIKKRLQTEYPEESHAFCSTWAIWRFEC